MADLAVAYVLWFFFGILGAHRCYLNQVGMGVLYFCTCGLFGIGWCIDLCLMPSLVDEYNRSMNPVVIVQQPTAQSNIVIQSNNSQMYGPPQGYPPQGYPPSPQGGYPPSGYPPSGYPPSGYPPSGYPPQGGYPPSGYPPSGYPPPEYPVQ